MKKYLLAPFLILATNFAFAETININNQTNSYIEVVNATQSSGVLNWFTKGQAYSANSTIPSVINFNWNSINYDFYATAQFRVQCPNNKYNYFTLTAHYAGFQVPLIDVSSISVGIGGYQCIQFLNGIGNTKNISFPNDYNHNGAITISVAPA